MRDDRAYYERRAEEALGMAEKAAAPQAVQAHYELACHYLDRAQAGAPEGSPLSKQVQAHLEARPRMLQQR